MGAIKLYHQSTSHTVNGLNAYQLLTTVGASSTSATTGYTGWAYTGPGTGYAESALYILHADTTTTTIATSIAQISLAANSGTITPTELSATYAISKLSLKATDALKLIVTLTATQSGTGNTTTTVTFVTQALKAVGIAATTLTFNYWIAAHANREVDVPYLVRYQTACIFYWGDSTYDSFINNLKLNYAGGYACLI